MPIRNRIVRSATWEGMCETNGKPTKRLIDYYRTLAQGGVGLIISGYTYVLPEGKQLPNKMGITTDDFAPEFKTLPGLFTKQAVPLPYSSYTPADRPILLQSDANPLLLQPSKLISIRKCPLR